MSSICRSVNGSTRFRARKIVPITAPSRSDLPDDFFAEPHGFETYIRFLTGRGGFGLDADPEAELARLRPRFGEQYSFERTRPDGRIIEVRHNPMPDGGVVLI